MHATVIIPGRNVAATLGAQLEGLLGQDHDGSWDVVVVDDGSADDTRAVAERYRDRLPGLTVVTNPEPTNVARARNVGRRHAVGDVLLFCDGDDVVSPSWMRSLLAAVEGGGVVAAGRSEVDRLNQRWAQAARDVPQQHGLQPWSDPPYLRHAGGGNLAVPRDVYDALGGFDEADDLRLNEAADFSWRAQLAGFPLVFVPEAAISIRLRSSLRGMFRQALGWGECSVSLHRKFARHGMPRPRWVRGLAGWVLLPLRLLAVRDRAGLGRWLHVAGYKTGRLVGSLRTRTLAL